MHNPQLSGMLVSASYTDILSFYDSIPIADHAHLYAQLSNNAKAKLLSALNTRKAPKCNTLNSTLIVDHKNFQPLKPHTMPIKGVPVHRIECVPARKRLAHGTFNFEYARREHILQSQYNALISELLEDK